MTTINTKVIPDTRPQWSQRAFRRYEPFIRSIIERYPLPSAINPHPLSGETFTHRMRDAISAFVVSSWPSDISRNACLNIFNHLNFGGDFVISYGKDAEQITWVYAGPRATHKFDARGVREANISIPAGKDQLDALQFPELFSAFAVLKNHELVEGPVAFVNVSDAQRREVDEKHPNVELLDEDNTTIMI